MQNNPAPLLESHSAVSAQLPGGPLAWLDRLRSDAITSYQTKGLPSRKLEEWRNTPLDHLNSLDLAPVELAEPATVDTVPSWQRDLVYSYSAVFVNGRYHAGLSQVPDLTGGAVIGSLAALLESHPDLVRSHVGQLAEIENRPMAALNTAYLGDGLVVVLPSGTILDRPIHLVNIAATTGNAVAIQPRHLFVLESAAAMTLVESNSGLGENAYLHNAVTEIALAAGARLQHIKAQREASNATHLAMTAVSVGEGAHYGAFTLHSGGALARQETYVDIAGRHGEARVSGAYLAAARQQQDNLTRIVHDTTDSVSRQNFRGIIDARGKGVFQGKVLVKRHAQRTDGHQLNRVLLLAPGARIDAKPELEIYADDVKCSHGATAGELDDNALFYLCARGIPRPIARRMLIEAFVGEALVEITDESIRNAFSALVREWLDEHIGVPA